ncbi:TIGR03086 family metal-binding protein [Actinopolymorpha singaporensis]|uniref:TIGR03086 family protein n=1 Tax=Actinopolymorpha singaporensis TaxID=117157 RepID=A0A1H1LHG7_9ACTN|nr:TIGR03086 family metal-binding protein [Actinopolymorpha singaporensis]SDR73475.1 TIGR03086 family protein [Actinopolymorpha singaporensis]
MRIQPLMARAARSAITVVRGVRPGQLGSPTPCTEYDVRALLNHLILWTGHVSELSARKRTVADLPDPAIMAPDHDFLHGDWAKAYDAQLDRAVAAWGEPGAEGGTTRMGGDTELPADFVAQMLFGELVLHGWDLARATGQRLDCPDDVARAAYDATARSADQAREMGLFGAAVEVPDTASELDKVLALSGRDPRWTP